VLSIWCGLLSEFDGDGLEAEHARGGDPTVPIRDAAGTVNLYALHHKPSGVRAQSSPASAVCACERMM
jgi:hypothetical protein